MCIDCKNCLSFGTVDPSSEELDKKFLNPIYPVCIGENQGFGVRIQITVMNMCMIGSKTQRHLGEKNKVKEQHLGTWNISHFSA